MAERVAQAKASGAAVAMSVTWPGGIGPEMRAAFPHDIVSAHAGDLPRYRGNACPNRAIIAGEQQAFATLHRMGEGVLVLDEIEVAGKGRGPAAQFVRSARARFGIDYAAEIAALRQRVDRLESHAQSGKSA